LTDKKNLQERFRKTLQRDDVATKSEITDESKPQLNDEPTASLNQEEVPRSVVEPKHRIDYRQNYKANNHKATPKKKFSTKGRYQQKHHSSKTKSHKINNPAQSKNPIIRESQKEEQSSSNFKSAVSSLGKGKEKARPPYGTEKVTINKQNKSKSNALNKKRLHQSGLALPYAIKNTTDNYGRIEEQKDSDDNSAVLATEESVSLARKAMSSADKIKQPKLKFEAPQDKRNVLSQQELSKQKLSYSKQASSGNAKTPHQKSQQKRSIKKSYGKGKQTAFNTGIKDRLQQVVKQVKEWATLGLKKFAIYMIGPVFVFVVASMLILATVQSFSGAVSTVFSTSYQSSDLVITNADVLYSRLEADLLYAINHVEEDHASYDEYHYNVDAVGHDPQMLIAYLTAKFGEFTDVDAGNELSRIFYLHYDYQLVEKIETRHRTVRETTVDPVTGETTTTTSQEEYDWHILKVNLDTNDLNQTLSSQLNEEEIDYYQTLISTEGNFISFLSPIREDWKTSVSSPFGYRLDPISKEVTFHAGIDIAKPTGTELITIIDGVVIQTGYDANGYGHFIVVEEKRSKQTVLYGHCNSLIASEGDEVKLGQTIATIGSSGKSTGPHVHLEIRDSSGNKLNPYFYLSSEFVEVE
jgi:murein DD-endopeptidase MepM/ murein hydrolase activator NlpD